jgi:hypothetical protein
MTMEYLSKLDVKQYITSSSHPINTGETEVCGRVGGKNPRSFLLHKYCDKLCNVVKTPLDFSLMSHSLAYLQFISEVDRKRFPNLQEIVDRDGTNTERSVSNIEIHI